MTHFSDALLPTATLRALPFSRTGLAAYVPITVALLGVAFIMLGGISARAPMVAANAVYDEPIITGSIAAPTIDFDALKHLDD